MNNRSHPLLKVANNALVDLPQLIYFSMMKFWITNMYKPNPSNCNSNPASHTLLSMYSMAFLSISHICRDVNQGWLLRTLYANGTSMFFLCIYMHIGRNMYYGWYKLVHTWMVGVVILFMTMATAFTGYVLLWCQMSFCGTTLITNFFSAFPYICKLMVQKVWGGFAVDNATLTRFFTLHFLMAFVLFAMAVIHLLFLHQTGSNNSMGLNKGTDKIPFHPYFTAKYLVWFMLTLMLLTVLTLKEPYMMGMPDFITPANPLVKPVHIQPEWYFLFTYAILRSIPNKLGVVIALAMSIAILFTLLAYMSKFRGMQFYTINQVMFWTVTNTVTLLTWIGSRPVEEPHILTGESLTTLYFTYYMMEHLMKKWDKMMNK